MPEYKAFDLFAKTIVKIYRAECKSEIVYYEIKCDKYVKVPLSRYALCNVQTVKLWLNINSQ